MLYLVRVEIATGVKNKILHFSEIKRGMLQIKQHKGRSPLRSYVFNSDSLPLPLVSEFLFDFYFILTYLLISDTDKFLFPVPLQFFAKLHCLMAKISEIKTNMDKHMEAYLSMHCYDLSLIYYKQMIHRLWRH